MVWLLALLCAVLENKDWLKDCPQSLSSIDGILMIFVLFSSLDQAEKYKKYLSSKHPNINIPLGIIQTSRNA